MNIFLPAYFIISLEWTVQAALNCVLGGLSYLEVKGVCPYLSINSN